MPKLTFQSIVQYQIDTDTNTVSILKKFTSPIKGAKDYNAKKVTKEQHDLSNDTMEVDYL